MGFYLNTTRLFRWFYPKNLIWEIPTQDKIAYLTFDDGPTPEVTNKVLELLDNYNAKASFFCLGQHVKSYPDAYQDVIKKGHAVGNHGYKHLNGWRINNDRFVENVKLAEHYIESKLFRPPYGRIKRSQAKILLKDYEIVMWSILTGDFDKNASKEDCWNHIKNHLCPGAIIVFHDSIKASVNMLYALEMTLKYFSKKGYQFKAITI